MQAESQSNGLKKDRNCIHCESFFDCQGKPAEVKDCLNFKERKEIDSGRKTQKTY